MKREWQKPTLEVLDINMTLSGPGIKLVDATYVDDDEVVHLNES